MATMTRAVRAIARDALWEGELRSLELAGERVVVVTAEGNVCAYRDRCAHLGLPISQGTLRGRTLTCPAHGWQYDAITGCGINPRRAKLDPLPLRIEDGDVLVEVERE